MHLRDWMEQGMKGLPRDSALLAVGCEQAFLAPQLAEYSDDVTVLDTCAGQIAQLARRFPEISFLQHQLTHRMPFAHDSFDAIWCCEYLDRVFDPVAALVELRRILAPGGRLLLTVPNHGAVHSLFGAFFGDDEAAQPTHPRLRHFSKSSLAVLAQDAGWTEIEICTGGTTRGPAGQLLRRSLFLTARKAPGARLSPIGAADRADEVEGLWDELAFAGRTLAA
jgi:2-polyprenyl-6-hydroxyphenyl methylase/3-demethylubiquinone-9 3-methyltransferase